jgi:cytochrome c peroxidase
MKTKCKIHPNYRAMRAPTSKKPACSCREVWNGRVAAVVMQAGKPVRSKRPVGWKPKTRVVLRAY